MGHQVHGAELRLARRAPGAPRVFADVVPSPVDVDAHATDQPGLVPLVIIADCLPVALAGPGGVAMVHGGWRGLAGGDRREGRGRAVGASAAAVGPGIGPCCYEVGDEVLGRVRRARRASAEGRMLDLPARRAGAARASRASTEVEATDLCTQLQPRALLLAPPRRRAHRPAGRARLARSRRAGSR